MNKTAYQKPTTDILSIRLHAIMQGASLGNGDNPNSINLNDADELPDGVTPQSRRGNSIWDDEY